MARYSQRSRVRSYQPSTSAITLYYDPGRLGTRCAAVVFVERWSFRSAELLLKFISATVHSAANKEVLPRIQPSLYQLRICDGLLDKSRFHPTRDRPAFAPTSALAAALRCRTRSELPRIIGSPQAYSMTIRTSRLERICLLPPRSLGTRFLPMVHSLEPCRSYPS
jgi:hypothetical protein